MLNAALLIFIALDCTAILGIVTTDYIQRRGF